MLIHIGLRTIELSGDVATRVDCDGRRKGGAGNGVVIYRERKNDDDAQVELTRISEGAGLVDTLSDLEDLVEFWAERAEAIRNTDITAKDLARAKELGAKLRPAAQREG